MDSVRKWREKSRRELMDCRIFHVLESERESPSGKKGRFFLLDSPDWVGVIPVVETPEGRKLVMIRQYRHGSDRISLEFPGGIVDPGEDPAVAAARELTEETGYRADLLFPLGTLSPNPAMMTNSFHAFVAEGCKLAEGQHLDEHEEIDVILVPEAEAVDMVCSEDQGHALMTAALFFYSRYRGRIL